MADVGDARLLAELTAMVPDRNLRDAVWAERFVGPVRVGALAVGVVLLVASAGVGTQASVVGVGLAIVAVALSWVAPLFIRPLALGLSGDHVLVFTSHRWRRTPIELTDVVATADIVLDFPGVLSDSWQIGVYRVGIGRAKRSRLRSWRTTESGEHAIRS